MTLSDHIILNGKAILSAEILNLKADKVADPSTPEWEKELYRFLEEWFSESEFVIAQTSGSTGEPQAIHLPKATMVQSARRTLEYFKLQEQNRILLSLPCRFIAGKMMIVRAIVGLMDLIAIDPSGDFDILRNESFDFGAMVPNQVFKLLESHSGKAKLENIRNLLIGGSAIPATLEQQIGQLKSRVVSTYGMTETASHIAIRGLSGENRSDIYNCLPGISVSANENDCLQIHVPELVEPLQTNDIAEILSATSFRILGRADDVIVSGGIKYQPEAIEKKLEHAITSRFVISAIPDEKLGAKLVLIIESEPTDTEAIQQKIALLLPALERPKAIYFLEKFPDTANGKVKRNEIKRAIHRF